MCITIGPCLCETKYFVLNSQIFRRVSTLSEWDKFLYIEGGGRMSLRICKNVKDLTKICHENTDA